MDAFKKKRRWHCLSGQEPTEMDKTIMYWENKGKLVPTRELIKTPEQIEGIRRAGVVNTGVLEAVAEAIHEGMNSHGHLGMGACFHGHFFAILLMVS